MDGCEVGRDKCVDRRADYMVMLTDGSMDVKLRRQMDE